MNFQQILAQFDIRRVYLVESYILGQQGLVFELPQAIAYLYEETRGNGTAEIFLGTDRLPLSSTEVAKLHSLLRLQRIEPRKLQQRDFWLYSMAIEQEVEQLLDKLPELVKGSTHMAFAPKNYTRFSENLLFDFDYLYDDLRTAGHIANYEQLQEELTKQYNYPISDDLIYRHLVDFVREHRISVNGRLSLPQFLRSIFAHVQSLSEPHIFLNTGPHLLQLRGSHPFINRRTSQLDQDLGDSLILTWDIDQLSEILQL